MTKITYTGDQVAEMISQNLRAAIDAAVEAAINFREMPDDLPDAEMGDWAGYYSREAAMKIAIQSAAYRATWAVNGPACVECDGLVEYL